MHNNCISIQVTLDSNREIHDSQRIFKNGNKSFDLIISNVKKSLKEIDCNGNTKFILRINLYNTNIFYVKETLENFDIEERKKINILFRPIYDTRNYTGFNKNSYKELGRYMKLAGDMGYNVLINTHPFQVCEACGDTNFFYLMPDLTMWKCINDLSVNYPKIGCMEESGKLNFDINKVIGWQKAADCFRVEECIECKMIPDCLGGCILDKLKNNKKFSCQDFEMISLPYFIENIHI